MGLLLQIFVYYFGLLKHKFVLDCYGENTHFLVSVVLRLAATGTVHQPERAASHCRPGGRRLGGEAGQGVRS